MTFVEWNKEVETSRRRLLPSRSHTAFAFGAHTCVRRTCTPRSVRLLSTSSEKILSRSWMRKRYGWSPGRASRALDPGFGTGSKSTTDVGAAFSTRLPLLGEAAWVR